MKPVPPGLPAGRVRQARFDLYTLNTAERKLLVVARVHLPGAEDQNLCRELTLTRRPGQATLSPPVCKRP